MYRVCILYSVQPSKNKAYPKRSFRGPRGFLDFQLIFKSKKSSGTYRKSLLFLSALQKQKTNSIVQNFHWTKKITSASSPSGHHVIRSKINAVKTTETPHCRTTFPDIYFSTLVNTRLASVTHVNYTERGGQGKCNRLSAPR